MLGIFDSGLGGLTVVGEIEKQLPGIKIVYLGDTARLPYGNKSPELVKKLAIDDVNFLLEQGANVVVAACNTVSAVAVKELQTKFPEVPIFNVVEPAVKKALSITKNGRIGVIGTRATISSGIYEKLLQKNGKVKVFSKATPLLVPLIEEGWLKKAETKRIARNYLQSFKVDGVDTFILGCTHYPLLKDVISDKLGKRITVVDAAEGVALEVKEYLAGKKRVEENLEKGGSEFFVTDKTEHFEQEASNWLGRKIELKEIDI